jgi:hypothetical protein
MQYYQEITVAVRNVDEWTSALMIAQEKLSAARRSVEELERIASISQDAERLARLTIAIRALDTAMEAVRH